MGNHSWWWKTTNQGVWSCPMSPLQHWIILIMIRNLLTRYALDLTMVITVITDGSVRKSEGMWRTCLTHCSYESRDAFTDICVPSIKASPSILARHDITFINIWGTKDASISIASQQHYNGILTASHSLTLTVHFIPMKLLNLLIYWCMQLWTNNGVPQWNTWNTAELPTLYH